MPLTKIEYDMIATQAVDKLTKTSAVVKAQKDIGYIHAGDDVLVGTTMQEFVEQLLITTFNPTLVEPTAGLAANKTLSQEAGTNLSSLTLTGSYTAGSVKGKNVNGLWMPNDTQSAAWTGAVTKYSFSGNGITGTVDNGTTAGYNVPGTVQLVDAGLSYAVSVDYAAGTYQPVNSKGADYDTIHLGGTVTHNLNFTAFRKLFYGVSSVSTSVPTDNATAATIVRGLAGSQASPANGTAFSLAPVSGTTRVMFAYPATLRDVTSVIDAATGYDIKGSFTKVTYTVPGAESYSPISYKIYYFVPPSPYSAGTTYSVVI